jgi:hypothetical protein
MQQASCRSIRYPNSKDQAKPISGTHLNYVFRIDGVSFIPLKPQGELPNCWICGGWMEVKYQYTPGISGTYTTPPIFLHLDFLNYQPILMNTNAELIAL